MKPSRLLNSPKAIRVAPDASSGVAFVRQLERPRLWLAILLPIMLVIGLSFARPHVPSLLPTGCERA